MSCVLFLSLWARRRINRASADPEKPISEAPPVERSAPAFFLRERGRNPNAASRHIPAELPRAPERLEWHCLRGIKRVLQSKRNSKVKLGRVQSGGAN